MVTVLLSLEVGAVDHDHNIFRFNGSTDHLNGVSSNQIVQFKNEFERSCS